MKLNKFTILLLTLSLLIGPSLFGGVDLLAQHFCSAANGSVCGMLQGIAAILNHLGSIQALFIFFAPAVFALLIIFSKYLYKAEFSIGNIFIKFIRLVSIARFGELHWAAIKTNSPNSF